MRYVQQCRTSAHLDEQDEKQRREECLQEHEPHQHLGVGPLENALAVVMERETHGMDHAHRWRLGGLLKFGQHAGMTHLHAEALKHAQQDKLSESAAAIDENDWRNRKHENRVARHQHADADQNPEETASGIAHQNL